MLIFSLELNYTIKEMHDIFIVCLVRETAGRSSQLFFFHELALESRRHIHYMSKESSLLIFPVHTDKCFQGINCLRIILNVPRKDLHCGIS